MPSTAKETLSTLEPTLPSKLEDAWVCIAVHARQALIILLFAAALSLLHNEQIAIMLANVAASSRSLSALAIGAAIALAASSYLLMIGYEWVGIRLIGRPVGNKWIATASLLSYALPIRL